MLPLKPFSFDEPQSLIELNALLAEANEKTKLMAGGTDLLPNLKHRLYDVDRIISLRRLDQLREITITDARLQLGALTSLTHLADSRAIERLMPALTHAARQIASPQIRNMATVGGNICLDTRCLYFNQTEFWRKALGYCLKKDGCACHVVKTGKRCVAAASNDLATVLLAYNADVHIVGSGISKTISLDSFYVNNGEKNNILAPYEVMTQISIDLAPSSLGGFHKVRMRNSIDFSMLSVAVNFSLDRGVFTNGKIVINALVAKPKLLDLADFVGRPYTRELVSDVALMAYKKCYPQTNIIGDVDYRKHMIEIATRRAFAHAHMFMD